MARTTRREFLTSSAMAAAATVAPRFATAQGRGGQDPMTILREAGKRIASLHVRNARNGVWLEELSDGDVDYREVALWLKEIGYQG